MPSRRAPEATGASGGYGSAPLKLWYHGLRDRLRGEHARANARWGHVRAPEGTGRVIWFKAGASERSVRLAAELLGAVRHKRLDVRLVLTFEEDFPEPLEARLKGMKKIGVGFGPCDAPRAVQRMLSRLSPLLGVVCVDTAPGSNLVRAAERAGVHVVAYNTVPSNGPVEACYPVNADMAETLRASGQCDYVGPAADPLAQLVEAQVEPSFRAMIGGAAEPTLAWMHFSDAASAVDAVRAWRAHSLSADSLLCVSVDGGTEGIESALSGSGGSVLRLSLWSRQPAEPGTLIWADEPRWYPALSVSSDLIHLAAAPRAVLWQALAGGVPVSFAPGKEPTALEEGEAGEAWAVDADMDACLARWEAYRTRPPEARRSGDACRRRLWVERRRSAEVVEELLKRMYDW
ncbi:MAG: glycosyltransferase N-terminal domain-containing protein [Gammaproteobacteria bacterium]